MVNRLNMPVEKTHNIHTQMEISAEEELVRGERTVDRKRGRIT